ncbi:MAG: hypothetical protein K6L76_09555 [Agarilytica sp.]
MNKFVFVNRRRGSDRKFESVVANDSPITLEAVPQKNELEERRDLSRNLVDDYYAYMQKTAEWMQSRLQSKEAKAK